MKKTVKLLFFLTLLLNFSYPKVIAASTPDFLKVDWSFKSFFGKFDRASLQRGYQVYNEVCASCHSLKYLSYRNHANEEEAKAANGGAYPPDMSVLVKARKGGADYIYSLLLGYEDPPADVKLDDGVYYNKYMYGNKIKMSAPLMDEIVEYSDGTKATTEQMAKDVVSFLMWAAEPHLEQRHKFGFRVIIYLVIISVLVYFSMKKIWSRIESKV